MRDLAGDKNGGRVRDTSLILAMSCDRPSRHRHVGDYQVDPALFKAPPRFLSAGKARPRGSRGFQHEFFGGKETVRCIYTESCAWVSSAFRNLSGAAQARPRETDRGFLNMKNVERDDANGWRAPL